MRDRGDELVLQSVEFGTMGELESVLMVLLTGLCQLFSKFAGRALRAQESEK
jgi:hypothetical protein